MLYKRLIWLKWRHPYNGVLLYIKNIFHFLTFQNSKLPKRAAKNTKNMTSFPCFVQSADFLPNVYPTILAGVSRGLWHPFLDTTFQVPPKELKQNSYFCFFLVQAIVLTVNSPGKFASRAARLWEADHPAPHLIRQNDVHFRSFLMWTWASVYNRHMAPPQYTLTVHSNWDLRQAERYRCKQRKTITMFVGLCCIIL